MSANRRRAAALLPFLLLCLAPLRAGAQAVVRSDETLEAHRPEAWAMNYVAASTLMTSFGETPAPGDARWRLALEVGAIPRLSEEQQRVGLVGTKQEDLNRSPVFGRLRLAAPLPGGFVAELGYTPPVAYRGARLLDFFAAAIGRRLFTGDGFSLSARLFGQHGRGRGDVTCPARLAGIEDRGRNPYGCGEPSDDQMAMNDYGVDATGAGSTGPWRWHAGGGVARTELAVQVDALTFGLRDRSRLVARGALPFGVAGVAYEGERRWRLAAEFLYVPLRVQRETGGPARSEPFTSLRAQASWRFE